ncbi:MAG: hypothetical protein K9W44_13415 [Candidatus Lokiarchaeota archaeon]|nr:hypothetical protein [Candidatus Harpocratesius repetitus]
MNDKKELFLKLKKDPITLYLIYQIFINRTDKLPDFMDKGKLIKILSRYDLAEKQIKKKHSHKNSLILLTEGKKFAKYLKERGIFSIFQSSPLSSQEEFEEYYMIHLQNIENAYEWQTNYDNYEILELYGIKPINVEYIQDNTRFKIIKFRCLDSIEGQFEFELFFKCKRCNKENIFTIQIKYSEDEYAPKYFDESCKKCGLIFHSDTFFKRFSMFEKK